MARRSVILLGFALAGALCLAACGGQPAASPTEAPSPLPSPTLPPVEAPTATPTPPPAPATVTHTAEPTATPSATVEPIATATYSGPPFTEEVQRIQAWDGLTLVGTLYTPQEGPPPWPMVLLLHMLFSDRGAWDGFVDQLTAAGYAVFALDMRGHGETGGDLNWEKAPGDMQKVWVHLTNRPDIAPTRFAIVGASIGANVALLAGANEPTIDTVVLLSPGLDYGGVTTEESIVTYGERPILIVASNEDTYSAQSSQTLSELAQGAVQLQLYDEAGHGTVMLDRQPDLAILIIDWLNQHLTE